MNVRFRTRACRTVLDAFSLQAAMGHSPRAGAEAEAMQRAAFHQHKDDAII